MTKKKGGWRNTGGEGNRGPGQYGNANRGRNGSNTNQNFANNGRGAGHVQGARHSDMNPNFQGQVVNWPNSNNQRGYGQIQQNQQRQRYNEDFSQYRQTSWQRVPRGGNQFNQQPANANNINFSSSNNQPLQRPIGEFNPFISTPDTRGHPECEAVQIQQLSPTKLNHVEVRHEYQGEPMKQVPIDSRASKTPTPSNPVTPLLPATPVVSMLAETPLTNKETEEKPKDDMKVDTETVKKKSKTSKPPENVNPPESRRSRKRKHRSNQENDNSETRQEEDVVHVANVEPRIDLVDDESTGNNVKSCLLCDKEGHTSLECQMICKNCSGPYHGYRNCPKPVNLGTMIHLLLEFLTQQFMQILKDRDDHEQSSGLMEWLKQFPGLILNTTDSTSSLQEEPASSGVSKSPTKSLKSGKQKHCTNESNRTPSPQKTRKRTRHNSGHEPAAIDAGNAQRDNEDDSTTTSDSGEEEQNIKQGGKRKARSVSSTIQGSGLNLELLAPMLNLNNQQQVDTSTTLNLLLGQLLQNAIRSNNS